MAIKRVKMVADFETTTDPTDLPVRVWGACAVELETIETLYLGNSIDEFFEYLSDKNSVCYFHNLKFDGEFIISWLLRNGYNCNETKEPKTFYTLISDMGAWYSITVIFEKRKKAYKKVVFYDSLKKLPFKVSQIAKAFELDESKLTIDYNAPRPVGHILTKEEEDYILADCRIMAKALTIQMGKGLNKMTIGSDALNGFKTMIGQKQFERYFPILPLAIDDDIRKAYKGGFVYLKPEHQHRRGLKGVTFDVNSLYPSVMYDKLLPYGYPLYFEGEPQDNETYPLFVARLKCAFDLKPNHLPTIQLKGNRGYIPTEYVTTTEGQIEELTLTSVDLDLFFEHYDVYNLEWVNGWRFRGMVGIFKEYIDFWMHIKETTTGAMRQLAKLMLNSLYGKFATNPRNGSRTPVLDLDGVVEYVDKEDEIGDPVYTAMGAFITAYARDKTIRSGQAVYDRFIYADTDSLHLIGHDDPPEMDIHPTRLGAWKNEGLFYDSIFIRAKTYMEQTDKGIKVTCAGMPDNIKEMVTFDNFRTGATFEGKLMPRRFEGGVILMPTTFTIK